MIILHVLLMDALFLLLLFLLIFLLLLLLLFSIAVGVWKVSVAGVCSSVDQARVMIRVSTFSVIFYIMNELCLPPNLSFILKLISHIAVSMVLLLSIWQHTVFQSVQQPQGSIYVLLLTISW